MIQFRIPQIKVIHFVLTALMALVAADLKGQSSYFDSYGWKVVNPASSWAPRAGLEVVHLNDDSAVIGPGGPPRIYFNDVWKSSDDGMTWQLVRADAPWEPRAGAATVVKDDFIYMLGGEGGFTCDSGGSHCPPYFNDVWRTQDGETWELVTADADWVERPGHEAVVVDNNIVLFGGFGLSTNPSNPFEPSNPIDMWISEDGAKWELLNVAPWNASAPEQIKYDFDALTVPGGPGRLPSVYTFGGDRETFNPFDPTNFLNVDNDVWIFSVVPEPSTTSLALIGLLGSLTIGRRFVALR